MSLPVRLCLFLLLGTAFVPCQGQNLYRVYLKDKKGVSYNPWAELHPQAIERRILHGLDLCDESDFPLNPDYVVRIAGLSDSIHGHSRWLNAMFVYAGDSGIRQIGKLDFVKHIEKSFPVTQSSVCSESKSKPEFDTTVSPYRLALLQAQLNRMGSRHFTDSNLTGKGVIVCVVDVGFRSYTYNPAFESIRQRKGILATYDFVRKRPLVDISMTHGTQVLSCIGGIAGPYRLGLATDAEFLLARTENITEFLNEEENWLMAAEWADKKGASIINSSLGYTKQRYIPENMDGKTTFVSRAAELAVGKGMLVVSSAGNEGNGPWKRVAAPGDAPGVLTVGGIDPESGIHIGFSSFGPSWDKRLKPEVTAFGKVVASDRNNLGIVDGTSFSAPLVTGFAACLKQKFPNLTNLQLKELICRSGDLWPYFDYAHGYGVPQPYFLFKDTLPNHPTLEISETETDVIFEFGDSTLAQIDTLPEPIAVDTTHPKTAIGPLVITKKKSDIEKIKDRLPDYLFYHVENKKGYLDKYYVMNPKEKDNKRVFISRDIAEKPFRIRLFYKGYYQEMEIRE